MKRERCAPKGNAIRWTAADIERMATTTDEDVACAKAMARRLAPKRLEKLLGSERGPQ